MSGLGESAAPAADVYRLSTLEAWCRQHDEPYGVPVAPAPRITMNIDRPGVAAPLTFHYNRPAMYFGRLREATILPPAGYICTPDGAVIHRGLTHHNGKPLNAIGPFLQEARSDGSFRLSLEPRGPTVKEECVFFGGSDNFGHFITENLLRLSLRKWVPDVADLPIAVYRHLPARFLEFLDLIGYPSTRRIQIAGGVATRFDKVWILSSPMFRESDTSDVEIWPEALTTLRADVARCFRNIGRSRPRLYVGRRNVRWRRMVNQDEIVGVLRSFGVEEIDLQPLSARDQIASVSNAEIIVTEFGAGAAITAFSPPDCIVIELAPPNFTAFFGPPVFAAVMGQMIYRITGRVATPDERSASGLPGAEVPHAFDRDYVMDREQLRIALALADQHCRRRTAEVQ